MKLRCSAPCRADLIIEMSDRPIQAAMAAARKRCPWAKLIVPLGKDEGGGMRDEGSQRIRPRLERFAVVVTCHAPYIKWLDECLDAWRVQAPHAEKFVVLDDCPADYRPPDGWQEIRGSFGHPGKARNAALEICQADWIWFWDADNHPYPHAFRSGIEQSGKCAAEVGVLAPGGRTGDPRTAPVLDTGSLWRREAILQVGGWPETWMEDWRLGILLDKHGWHLAHLEGVDMSFRCHAEQRRYTKRIEDKLWTARDLDLVFRTTGDLRRLDAWTLAMADLIDWPDPARVFLTVLDDSTRCSEMGAFQRKLKRALGRVAVLLRGFSVIRPGANLSEAGKWNEAVRVGNGELILTWDECVMPTERGAVKRLCDWVNRSENQAGVSALIPDTDNDDGYGVGGLRHDERIWLADWADADLPAPIEWIGHEFTVWQRPALERCPILERRSGPHGWQMFLAERLGYEYWTVELDGRTHVTRLD